MLKKQSILLSYDEVRRLQIEIFSSPIFTRTQWALRLGRADANLPLNASSSRVHFAL